MAIVSNQELLRRVSLFGALTPAQTGIVAETMTKMRFRRGQAIVRQGETSNALYVLLAGKARVTAHDATGERIVIMATLLPGDCVGEMSLIDGNPHSATVLAEAQTDTLVLERNAFMHCMHENTAVADNVMRALVSRLRRADRQIRSLALMNVYERVLETLRDLAQEAPDGSLVIPQKISRQDVAQMVGASREMVSRVMKHYEREGVITPLPDAAGVLLLPPSQSAD